MNVLGLDLSVRATGITYPDGAMATFRPDRNDDWRLVEIRNHIINTVTTHSVDLVMLEAPFVTANAAGLMLLQVHGAVKVALLSNRVPYLCPANQLVKMFALGKGSGKGTTKIDVVKALLRHTAGAVDPDDADQADSWWLWAMGRTLAGHPPLDLPQTHLRALDNLRLPAALRQGTTP